MYFQNLIEIFIKFGSSFLSKFQMIDFLLTFCSSNYKKPLHPINIHINCKNVSIYPVLIKI